MRLPTIRHRPGLKPRHDDHPTAPEPTDDLDAPEFEIDEHRGEPKPAPTDVAAETGRRQQWIAAVTARWRVVAVLGTFAAVVVGLAITAGVVKWHETDLRANASARDESVQAARDATVAMLSYEPNSAAQQLGAARDLLTGGFRDSYIQLTDGVVIPGAQQKQIAASATVPAAASVSADSRHAVVLVFVNQTTTVGSGAPSDMASSVKVTLDKVDGRWLVSQFEPI